MIEFTPREIRAIGERRWLNQKQRIFKSIGSLVGALVVDIVLNIILKNHLSVVALDAIMIVVFLLAFWYYVKVFVVDSTKVGRQFLEEYQKERQS